MSTDRNKAMPSARGPSPGPPKEDGKKTTGPDEWTEEWRFEMHQKKRAFSAVAVISWLLPASPPVKIENPRGSCELVSADEAGLTASSVGPCVENNRFSRAI